MMEPVNNQIVNVKLKHPVQMEKKDVQMDLVNPNKMIVELQLPVHF